MKLFLEENRTKLYIIASALAVALLALGIFIGMLIAQRAESKSSQTAPALDIQAAAEPSPDVNEDTEEQMLSRVVTRTVFLRCGHEFEESRDEALSMKEAEMKYSGYRLTDRKDDAATFQREIDDYCPKHFILVRRDQKLNVEQCDAQTGERIVVRELEAELRPFSKESTGELEEGIVFDELSQIDEYIENMES